MEDTEWIIFQRFTSIITCFYRKFDWQKRQKPKELLRDVSLEEQTSYAAEDADVTFQLYEIFAPQLKKKEGVEDLFYQIEMPLMQGFGKNGICREFL